MEPDTQSTTTSPAPRRDDLLADAGCLKCGYSLRGLPENRCPECGTAFDPQEVATSFVVLWPRLLMWYLVAQVVLSLVDLPHIVHLLPYFINSGTSSIRSSLSIAAWLPEWVVSIVLGPLVICGLYRRRDWARRGAVLIFAFAFLKSLTELVLAAAGLTTRGTSAMDWLFYAIAPFIAGCVPPLLLIVFLVTGLRPRSLIRSHGTVQPLLKLGHSHARYDWQLLMVLILTGAGVAGTCMAARLLFNRLNPSSARAWSSVGTWELVWSLAYLVVLLAIGVCTLAAAACIWRRPQTLRAVLTALTVLSATPLPLAILIDMNRTGAGGFRDYGSLAVVPPLLVRIASPVVVPLVLLLFAFLAVKREDIDRLDREDGRGA